MVKNVQRRLAAILAADMVGYSRLMEADETGTLAALKAHRSELIDPTIAEHNGRIVKTTGDGMLAEFGSVVDAVASAVAIQRAMAARNEAVPEGDGWCLGPTRPGQAVFGTHPLMGQYAEKPEPSMGRNTIAMAARRIKHGAASLKNTDELQRFVEEWIKRGFGVNAITAPRPIVPSACESGNTNRRGAGQEFLI